MVETNVNSSQASSPDPMYTLGSTTTSASKKETVGGQTSDVKQNEKATGTAGTSLTSGTTAPDDVKVYEPLKSSLPWNQNADVPPGCPELPPVKPFQMGAINCDFQKWFMQTYMTKLSMTMTQIVMTYKDIHKQEGIVAVQQIEQAWKLAVATAELIVAKAAQEAAMHMAIAIAAVASTVVAALGTVATISGKGISGAAKGDLAKLETPTPTQTTAIASAKPTAPGAPVTPPPARPAGDAPLNPPPATANRQDQAQPTTQTADQKLTETLRLNAEKTRGAKYHAIGMGLTNMAPSINTIFENSIQAICKPYIASYEAQQKLVETAQNLAMKQIDRAISELSNASEEVKNAIRTLGDIIKESIKANAITRN